MEIYNEKLKVSVFQFNENELKNSSELISTTFQESEYYPKEKKYNYGIRFRTLITNKENNKKVLLYKSEWIFKILPESKWNDIIYIRELTERAFTSHENYYYKNKSNELNVESIFHDKSINSFSDNIFSHLKQHNFY